MPKLEELCEFIIDCLHSTAPIENMETGYYSIRTPDIGRGRLILDSANRVSEETYQQWTIRAIPQYGDLILAREAPIGNVALVPSDTKVCLGQRTVHIRPVVSKIDPIFLVYYLLTDEIQGRFHGYSAGVTVPHLNMKDIRNLPLPIFPDLSTQRRIASILSAYDDLIENNNRRIVLLEESMRLLYREWFVRLRFPGHEHVRMVNGLPEGWERKMLGDVVALNYGKGLKEDNRIIGDVPVYGSSGIVGYHNDALTEGPVIIVGRKGNVGSVYWSNKDCFPIDTVYYINKDQVSPYVFLNLQNQNFVSSDVAVPGLNRNHAYSLPILIPNYALLNKFNEIIEIIIRQIDTLKANSSKLVEARDQLLPRLMSGEIDI